jgi:hypothetical protein
MSGADIVGLDTIIIFDVSSLPAQRRHIPWTVGQYCFTISNGNSASMSWRAIRFATNLTAAFFAAPKFGFLRLT